MAVHDSSVTLVVPFLVLCSVAMVTSRCCNAEDRELQEFAATCPGGRQVQYWQCCGKSGSCNIFCCNCDDTCMDGGETSPGGLLLHFLKNGLKNAAEYSDVIGLLAGLGRRRRDVTADLDVEEREAEEKLNTLGHFVNIDQNKDGFIDKQEAYVAWFTEMLQQPPRTDVMPDWFIESFDAMDKNMNSVLEPSEFDHDLISYDL